MTLRPLADLSPADWFVHDASPSSLRGRLGPSCFEAYVRVLHASSSTGDRSEGHLDAPLLGALVDDLAQHTTTPDRCYFALWEGYGDIHGGEAARFLTAFSGPTRWPGRIFSADKPKAPPPPAFPAHVMDGPLLQVGGEQHFLFGGRLAEAGQWGAASWGGGAPRDINSPNLIWPTDHAWFVTTTIDGTWTGVGGSAALAETLLGDRRLEVVRQRYDEGSLR
jgi:hypothetical protein